MKVLMAVLGLAGWISALAADKPTAAITLQRDGIIPTNTSAFQAYAFTTLLAQANWIAKQWELDIPLPITTNRVTSFGATPTTNGLRGSIQVDDKYWFDVREGRFSRYVDARYESSQSIVHGSVERKDSLIRMTNLLTLESALALAKEKIHKLGIDEKKLGLGEPATVAQWKDDSNGVIYPLPLYVVRWQAVVPVAQWPVAVQERALAQGADSTGAYLVVDTEISGLSSNVAMIHYTVPAGLLAPPLQVPIPTNYLQMLGLPTNVTFLPHDWERRQRMLRSVKPNSPTNLQ